MGSKQRGADGGQQIKISDLLTPGAGCHTRVVFVIKGLRWSSGQHIFPALGISFRPVGVGGHIAQDNCRVSSFHKVEGKNICSGSSQQEVAGKQALTFVNSSEFHSNILHMLVIY